MLLRIPVTLVIDAVCVTKSGAECIDNQLKVSGLPAMQKGVTMFHLTIGGTRVVFAKFFKPSHGTSALEHIPDKTRCVVFLDTGVTPHLATTIETLVERGVEVHVRDHHKGEGNTPEAVARVEGLLGERAVIVKRKQAPACSQLVEVGEFAVSGTVIVADPDLDGLTTAMKACGVTYEGLDDDARVFDVRPLQREESLTELGWIVVRSLSSLPGPKTGWKRTNAQRKLFRDFVLAAQSDVEAHSRLVKATKPYKKRVAEAKRLLDEKMSHPCSGVALVDQRGAKPYDHNTLVFGMQDAGALVIVILKGFGAIVAEAKVEAQYWISVAYDRQDELDLRELVPAKADRGPKAGLISNNAHLLHCSEAVWNATILPALRTRLGSS